jgi:hypothetical protein
MQLILFNVEILFTICLMNMSITVIQYAHEFYSNVTSLVFRIILSSVYIGNGESVNFLMWEQVGSKSHYTSWQDNEDDSSHEGSIVQCGP